MRSGTLDELTRGERAKARSARWWALLALCWMCVLSGCSGCDEPEDRCQDTVCERGQCSAQSGQCVNPSTCASDEACLEGFACSAQQRCEPQLACAADGSCERGRCVQGACVNSPTCSSDDACVPTSYCDLTTNTCASDPCQDGRVSCARGVCDRRQAACVNEVVCVAQDEQSACLEGYRCVGQSCVDEATFCGQLACDRGECSFAQLACVNAARCQGEDRRCLAGAYCAPDGTCQPNVCDAAMTQCARGQCDPASGQCVNPASCQRAADCIDAHACVQDRCVPQAEACGPQGCSGTLICQIDDAARAARCVEDPVAGCASALDCVEDRVCLQGQCADAPMCPAEDSPNDTEATATDFAQAAPDQRLEAGLCAGDVDFYRLNTRAQVPSTGRLVVDLSVRALDQGLGSPLLELRDPFNMVVASQRAVQGRARVEADVTVLTQGEYLIVVRDSGDVKTSGLRYTLAAGVFEAPTIAACQSPRALTPGVAVTSSTQQGASTGLRVTCGADQVLIPEDIYSFTLTQRSFVTLKLTPDAGQPALAMSLRADCLASQDLACAGGVSAASPGELERPLAPGTYVVVVQSMDPAQGGSYTLELSTQMAVCSPADNSCKDMSTGLECNAQGTAFEEVACGTGCSLAAGRCDDLLGDGCAAPVVFQGPTQRVSVPWARLTNRVDPGAQGCVPQLGGASATSGPDLIVRVEVPARQALLASLGDAGADTSLYLLDDCADSSTCLSAVNASASSEQLAWYNDSAQARVVSLVADIAQAASKASPSTLDLEVKPAICAPGQDACGVDANGQSVSRLCDAQGGAFTSTTPCAFGCEATTGRCALPPNDQCGGAVRLTSGVAVTGDLGPYVSDYPLSGTASCVGVTTRQDAIYQIALQAGQVLDVELTAPFNPVLWISASCAMDQLGACLIGSNRASSNGTERLRFVAPAAGDYYIVATTTNVSSTNGWAFTLKATAQAPQCTPGSSPTCDAQGVSLEYCDVYGLTQRVTCQGGCSAGACATPRGDVCPDAVALTGASGSVNGSFNVGTDQFFAPQGYSGQCYVHLQSQSTIGPDTFYKLELQAGQLATLTLTTTNASGSLFLLEGCDGMDACVANNPLRGATTLQYLAPRAMTLYAVVDSSLTTSTTTYTLDWSVSAGGACAPGASRCQDANTAAVCAADGSAETLIACPAGCERQGCRPSLPAQDTCAAVAASPADIGQGVSIYADFGALTPDVTMTTTGSCVDGRASGGPDVFYKVNLPASFVLSAAVQGLGNNNPVIYAITDCADAEGTCVAGGGEVGTTDRASLQYVNATGAAQTLIVAIDSSLTSPAGPFLAQIEVLPPQCMPGDLRCDASGQGVEVCNANSIYELYPCAGACTAGRCDTPSGDFCQDAIPLVGASGSVTGDWTTGTNTYAPGEGVLGGCYVRLASQASAGRDRFYRVDLQAGELLTLGLTTTSTTASLFILEDCVDPSACALNNPTRGAATLQYHAPTARSVFVVVDNSSTTLTTPYTLDWSVSAGLTCAPGASRCVDATTAALCAADGSAESLYTCANGCSWAGCAVTAAAQDSCAAVFAAAQDIGQGLSMVAEYADYTNDVTMTAAASCADGRAASGRDFFHKVTLAPGEILVASAQGTGNGNPLIYAITDCADAEGSCVAGGGEVGTTERASFTYANSSSATQTLIVVVDSSLTSPTGLVLVQLAKVPPQCVPGQLQCDPAGSALLACSQAGLFERVPCATTCTAGRCDEPQGDLCVDAIELIGASGSISSTWSGGTNAYTLPSGDTGGCYIHSTFTPLNRDAFYRVQLQAGDRLDATLTTTSTTAYLFMLEGCVRADQCLKNNPLRGSTTLSYIAPSAQTITLVADGSSLVTTAYTLSWTVTPGAGLCVPNELRCVDAVTAALCAADGQSEAQYTCANGCARGGCSPDVATQDSCAAVLAGAQDIGQGLTAVADYASFTNDVSMTAATSCADGRATSGRDLFYKVVLSPGEILSVAAQGLGNSNPAVYAIADCADAAGSCVAGGAEVGSTDRASFIYGNSTNATQTLAIVIDSSLTTPTGPVQITMRVDQPQCTPGASQCDPTGQGLQVCNASSLFDFYPCDGGCAAGACLNPKGDFCQDAIPLVGASGSVTGDWTTGTNTYAPGEGVLGGCYVRLASQASAGRDRFYRVDLQAGELLTLGLTTTSTTASLFILEDCVDPSACALNNPTRGAATLQYHAPTARSVFVVVDNSSTTLTTPYTLSWEIEGGYVCAPNQASCVDPNTVARCDAQGASQALAACPGGCQGVGCVPVPTQDSCAAVLAGAQDIGQGLTAVADYASFTNDVSMTAATSCADGRATSGRDFFYKVTLAPGQILTAWAQGTGNGNPALYAITDCADAAGSCVAGGAEVGSTERASFTYVNSTNATQTLAVVVDSSLASPTGLVQVSMDVRAPECAPGALQCNATATALLLCNQVGLYEVIPCRGGCAANACADPRGDYCVDAIPLVGASGAVSGDFNSNATNTFQLPDGWSGGCFMESATLTNVSQETFYRIDLLAGQELVLGLSSGSTTAQLLIVEDCADLAGSCVTSSPARGSTTLRYYAQTSRAVYIAVDNTSTSAAQGYTLSWGVGSGTLCASQSSRCLDPNTASICSIDGLTQSPMTCANGCFQGGCQAQVMANDSCADVLSMGQDIGAGLAVYADFTAFTNSVGFTTTTSCADGRATAGRDLFYKMTLNPGQIARVQAQGYRNNNPAVYILEDCSATAASCLAGGAELGSTDRATASYVNQTAAPKTVILGVDSTLSTNAGPVLARLERLDPECTPGARQCASNGLELLGCNSLGLYEAFTCEGGCLNGACAINTGDLCFDAVTLNPGGTMMSQRYTDVVSNFQTYSPQLTLGTSGCLGAQDAEGPEKFYAVILAPGQRLDATMVPDSTDIALYVVTDCTDALSCVAPTNNAEAGGFGVTERVQYTNATAATQTVFLVADSHGTAAAGGYSLTVDIQ